MDFSKNYTRSLHSSIDVKKISLLRHRREQYETISKGFLSFLYLPYDPLWYFLLNFGSGLETLLFAFESSPYHFATSSREKDVLLFSFDIFYTLDVVILILSKIFHKKINLPPMVPSNRPIWIICFEVFSCIPLELTTSKTKNLHYILRLTRMLRVLRIFYYIYYRYQMLETSVTSKLVTHLFTAALYGVLTYSIVYHILCTFDNCSDIADYNIKLFMAVVSTVTCQGFGQEKHNSFTEALTSAYLYIGYFCIICVNVAFLINDCSHSQAHKHRFTSASHHIIKFLKSQNVSKSVLNLCNDYFVTFWTKRGGYQDNYSFKTLIPLPMYQEMLLDICWAPLKHSNLFKEIDMPFGRFIAMYMKSTFMVAGQIIYHKNSMRSKMIYVLSGIIEIISEQDDKTPILSFSCGTVLGEASLFVSYKSRNTVRCLNYCEIIELDKKDFLKAITIYPQYYHQYRRTVYERYEEAKYINKISNYFNSESCAETKNATITWMKNTLHGLMAHSRNTVQEQHNIYLQFENHENAIFKILFCAKYLDNLAITERVELNRDAIFINTKFPYILQPDTIFHKFWEGIVLLILIFAMILIPHYCFHQSFEIERKISLLFYLINVIWIVDFLIKISTAVVTKDKVVGVITRILLSRLNSFHFILDIFSMIPMEFLSALIVTSMSPQIKAYLQLNKLLKAYRVHDFFELLEDKLNVNLLLVKMLRYTCILAYLIFITAHIIFTVNCNYYNHCNYYNNQYSIYFPAIQLITGIGLVTKWDNLYNFHYAVVFTTIVGFLFIFMSYVIMSVQYSMDYNTNLQVQGLALDFHDIFDITTISKDTKQRIINYINAQVISDLGIDLVQRDYENRMPTYLFQIERESLYANTIRNTKYFSGLDESVITDICTNMNRIVLPPQEVVCYADNVCTHIFILIQGICNIGNPNKIVMPGDTICMLESFYDLPVLKTCVCKTYCTFISIDVMSLQHIYCKYALVFEEHKILKKNTEDIATNAARLPNDSMDLSHWKYKTMEFESFFEFPLLLEPNSFMEYEYYNPFDKSYFFRWSKVILSRRTIIPEGKFMMYWECSRSFFSVMSAILFTLHLSGTCTKCPEMYVRVFLDITALIDIYVRMHISYYNKQGILVIHPYHTARHYIRHGFVIDLLSILPVTSFLNMDLKRDTSLRRFFNGLRLLQLYRFIQFRNYLHKTSDVPQLGVFLFTFIPLIIILCCVTGSYAFTNECYFHTSIIGNGIYADKVRCTTNSIWSRSNYTKELTALDIQLYAIYIATSILTTTGMQGFNIETYSMGFTISIVSLIGHFVTIHIMSEIISNCSFGNPSVLAYVENMKSLKKFLKDLHVDRSSQNNILSYYEIKWNNEQGKNIYKLSKFFHIPLKEDLLFDIYGENLMKYIFISTKYKQLLKELIIHSRYYSIPSGGKIISLNDITKSAIIISKGFVDLISANGSPLVTLSVGSIFGNLDRPNYKRMDLNAVARGFVEILVIPSAKFFALIGKYRDVSYITSVQLAEYKFYIPSIYEYKHLTITDATSRLVIDSECFLVKAMTFINILFCCTVCISLCVYQMAFKSLKLEIDRVIDICDILYVFYLYIRYHKTFQDELGYKVRNIQKVREHHMNRSKFQWRFYMDMFGALPLNMLIFICLDSSWLPHLRLNRIARIFNIQEFFMIRRNKLSSYQGFMEILSIILWSTLLIHCMTCFFTWIVCSNDSNIIPPMKCQELKSFEIYVRFLLIILKIFTKSAENSLLPNSPLVACSLIIIMIAMLLISSLFYAAIFYIIYINFHGRALYEKRWHKLKYFMNRENVSPIISSKVVKYVQKIWLKNHGILTPAMLTRAPMYLQEEIYYSAFGKEFLNHPIFCKFHNDLIRQILPKLQQNIYFPDDYVSFLDDVNEFTYFVKSGSIAAMSVEMDLSEIDVTTYHSGDVFCIKNGLFSGKKNKFQYKAITFSVVISLSYSSWIYLLDYFPSCKELFDEFVSYYNF